MTQVLEITPPAGNRVAVVKDHIVVVHQLTRHGDESHSPEERTRLTLSDGTTLVCLESFDSILSKLDQHAVNPIRVPKRGRPSTEDGSP